MATVQKQLLKFALAVDGTTKKGFKFNDATAALTVNGATNASPIVISTTTNHGLVTGQQVYVASVGGNTAANNTASNPNWSITRVNATTFSLDGSTGNGAYTSGGTATAELIGSVDPASMPRQRLLDIYNFARLALFSALFKRFGKNGEGEQLVSTTITFTSAAAKTTAPKPTGFLELESLHLVTTFVPIYVKDPSYIQEVKLGRNLDFKQSATNIFAFDEGTTFASYGTVGINSGNAYVAGAGHYIVYYGITDFTLTDVLGNSTVETFNDKRLPQIIELAQAIYSEQGEQAINALAEKLVGE